jgi:hypothetical protein
MSILTMLFATREGKRTVKGRILCDTLSLLRKLFSSILKYFAVKLVNYTDQPPD